MTDEEAIARGIHAQQILDDPIVVETFAMLEAAYIRQWREAHGVEAREAMWLLLQNLDTFRGSFGAYIRAGKMALAANERRELTKKQDAAN